MRLTVCQLPDTSSSMANVGAERRDPALFDVPAAVHDDACQFLHDRGGFAADGGDDHELFHPKKSRGVASPAVYLERVHALQRLRVARGCARPVLSFAFFFAAQQGFDDVVRQHGGGCHADGCRRRGELSASSRSVIDFHVEQGTEVLVVAGTTGESATLDHDEHVEVLEKACELAAGRIPIVAGTGSNSTTQTLKLSRAVDRLPIAAFLVVTPYYNKPPQEGMRRHFSAIADAVQHAR